MAHSEGIDTARTLEVHPWQIIETQPDPVHRKKHETLFSLGNGYLGLRGSFEEGIKDETSDRGAYINGIYDYYPYVYNWRRTAYPPRGHSMLNVADYNIIAARINDEQVNVLDDDVTDYKRVLDMRSGLLTRSFLWTAPGAAAHVTIERFVSMARPHCVAYRYSVTPVDINAQIEFESSIDGDVKNVNWKKRALHTIHLGDRNGAIFLTQRTSESNFSLGFAALHKTSGDFTSLKHTVDGERVNTLVAFNGRPNQACILEKYVAIFDSRDIPEAELVNAAIREAESAAEAGFDALLKEHADYWADFWNDADLQIVGDDAAQQGVRYALFQLAQSTGRDGKTNCGANGLTGEAYNGHVFWDSEMYILPAFLYSRPEIARSMMEYRYWILPEARKRAQELEHPGACFSWESISGEECGWIFEAATDQYHLQSDIAYAIIKYYEATGDDDFLTNYGAEVLFETAKCMAHRGAFIPLKDNKFCINVVCGPDEYTPAVDNNCYTNCLCKLHLDYAEKLARRMEREFPQKWADLCSRLELTDEELDLWRRASDNMYIPYDEKLGINPQDDQFLYRDPVDVNELKKRGYILMNMHPLNLWRFQVAKQADVVLLNLVLGNWFSPELKKANFDYYEPKTIHDSSLSPSIHSIMASEIGYREKAYEYFTRTARMDLDDVKGNTAGGCHTACMGGSWMTIVYGFGGMRVYDGKVHLDPYVPEDWESYSFKILFRGARMGVNVTKTGTKLSLLEGNSFEVEIAGKNVTLTVSQPEVEIPA